MDQIAALLLLLFRNWESAKDTLAIAKRPQYDAVWRSLNIGKAMGVDLAELRAHGRITREEVDCLLSKCAICPSRDMCTMWMEARKGEIRAVPSRCPNVRAYRELREAALTVNS